MNFFEFKLEAKTRNKNAYDLMSEGDCTVLSISSVPGKLTLFSKKKKFKKTDTTKWEEFEFKPSTQLNQLTSIRKVVFPERTKLQKQKKTKKNFTYRVRQTGNTFFSFVCFRASLQNKTYDTLKCKNRFVSQ